MIDVVTSGNEQKKARKSGNARNPRGLAHKAVAKQIIAKKENDSSEWKAKKYQKRVFDKISELRQLATVHRSLLFWSLDF